MIKLLTAIFIFTLTSCASYTELRSDQKINGVVIEGSILILKEDTSVSKKKTICSLSKGIYYLDNFRTNSQQIFYVSSREVGYNESSLLGRFASESEVYDVGGIAFVLGDNISAYCWVQARQGRLALKFIEPFDYEIMNQK